MSYLRPHSGLALRLVAVCTVLGLIGPQLVVGSTAVVGPSTLVTGPTPFAAGCNGPDVGGTTYPNAEVEPRVAVNPTNAANIVGAWQQDRISSGASNGLGIGVSHNGGTTWTSHFLPVSHCAGGNATNGGDYARATDPWVSFGPTGIAYFLSQGVDFASGSSGVVAYRSTNGGDTWSAGTTLIRDTNFNVLNDKISITADPTNANDAYAVWDRLVFPNANASPIGGENAIGYRGPGLFARTTDGGVTWEPTRINFDPGEVNQILGAQVVVLPNGTLIEGFALIYNVKNSHKVRGVNVAVIRSTDKGLTWSDPVIVSKMNALTVTDPETGEPLRTGDIIPEFAVDRTTGAAYATWQDGRWSGGARSAVAFSKSTDGGLTWSTPVAVNTDTSVQAFLPTIATSSNGTVGLTYYDVRNDTADASTLLTDVWFIHSHDGAATWSESRVTPTSFDFRTAPVSRGFFVGDYEGLDSGGSTFSALYVKTNSGNTSNRTDVYFNPIGP